MRTTPTRRLLAMLLAIAIAGAACGDSGDGDSTTTEQPGDESVAEVPDAAPVVPTEEPPVPLTASDTGVTPEVIRLGVAYPDLSVVGRDNGDVEAKFRVAIDAVNDAGGVNGRTIELHFGTYHPLEDADFDAMCARHTEDIEVFAVIGIFLREQVLCYTALHDTIAINHLSIEESQLSQSTAPLLAVPALSARTVEANVAALMDNGVLSAGSPVAVHGNSLDEDLHQLYVDALDAAGIEVVSDTLRTQGTDIQAAKTEIAVFAEKWVSDGAVAVVGTVDVLAGDLFYAADTVGLDFPIVLPEGLDRPPSLIESTLGEIDSWDVGVPLIQDEGFVPQWADDINGVRECAARFEAATGETIYTTETGEEPLENLGPTALACELVELFAAVATEAGPDLTRDSFAAAAESIGSFAVTGVSAGSFGPDKPDYTDVEPRIGAYNPDSDQFEVAG